MQPSAASDPMPGQAFRRGAEIRRVVARCPGGDLLAYELPGAEACSLDCRAVSPRGLAMSVTSAAGFTAWAEARAPGHDTALAGDEDPYGDGTLMLLIDEIAAGRGGGASGQLLGAMCSARDDLVRLRRALATLRDCLRADGHVWLRDPDGTERRGPPAAAFIEGVLRDGA